ncbi:heparinase II/III family protein [Kiritimatiellaeota bacterium B1221]|nr:heparinase II/III family protein [Kiritimatiellaeota bacterium B1221]
MSNVFRGDRGDTEADFIMSIFLNETERLAFKALRPTCPVAEGLFWGLSSRVSERAASPGLSDRNTTSDWWHHAGEYLSDAAMVHAVKSSPQLRAWLRASTLEIVRRPVADWVGPWFREHGPNAVGHLETAHLSWGVASVLDLAADLFSASELEEIREALRVKGIHLCRRFLLERTSYMNWRAVLNAGLSVAAAVLGDEEAMAEGAEHYRSCAGMFQADGSYGESLQYGNYAAFSQMLSYEALTRAGIKDLPLDPMVHQPRWQAASHFYNKPLSGWGQVPRARAANFNDSAAIFRPSADVLLHVAARGKADYAQDAGLARWLFEETYVPIHNAGPHDLASFGFVNDFGFMSLPLWTEAAEALTPEAAGLTELEAFSVGDVLMRDAWEGQTIVAVHGGGDPFECIGHQHRDLNSFILAHRQERLLVDPGHSCYRSFVHTNVEMGSATHNTCTFMIPGKGWCEQKTPAKRQIDPKTNVCSDTVVRGASRKLAASLDDVRIVQSDAAVAYGDPIRTFLRSWILCGSHVLFVVDHVVADEPVKAQWHWLFNNRDGALEMKPVPPDRLVARRNGVGCKMFHLGGANVSGPAYSFMHDAYHPLPGQLGEGGSGSAWKMQWAEQEARCEREMIHAVCFDEYGKTAGWHLREQDGVDAILESPGATESWALVLKENDQFEITEAVSGRRYLSTPDGLNKL